MVKKKLVLSYHIKIFHIEDSKLLQHIFLYDFKKFDNQLIFFFAHTLYHFVLLAIILAKVI